MDYVNAFSDQFRDACQMWRAYFSQQLEACGQTITKARALIYLQESEARLTQKELANLLSIEEPSVVRMLDGLEKEGLIQRKTVYQDKRSKHVLLTEAAAPLVEKIQAASLKARMDGLKDIPEEKVAIASEVLKMIMKNVG